MRQFEFDIDGTYYAEHGYSNFDARVRLCNRIGVIYRNVKILPWRWA
jgi:hypothetical protein